MEDDKKNKCDYKRKSVKSLPKVKTNKPSFPTGLNELIYLHKIQRRIHVPLILFSLKKEEVFVVFLVHLALEKLGLRVHQNVPSLMSQADKRAQKRVHHARGTLD